MALANLTLYTGLKSIHVLASTIWLGGGVIFAILGIRAIRTDDPIRLLTIAREISAVASKLFPVMGIILIGTGFWMVAEGDLDFDTWVIIGLVGWAATFVTGAAVLGPRAERMKEAVEQQGPESEEAQARVRNLLALARIDLVVLAIVVVDMVVKPT